MCLCFPSPEHGLIVVAATDEFTVRQMATTRGAAIARIRDMLPYVTTPYR